ncbi:MAG: GNAT family N-acetyltransferase [Nitrososphaerota archaeon]|nr:GNAT family N-acetyltransferase [Nitrososphaerota archaeon]
MRIRNFSLKDYDEVVSLWKECKLEIRAGDTIKEIKTKILRDPELFLVAIEDGKIIGAVMGAWDGPRDWIYHLGVLPSYQRTGVASKLVEEVEKRMRKKGVVKVNALVLRME